jgi:cyanophycinase
MKTLLALGLVGLSLAALSASAITSPFDSAPTRAGLVVAVGGGGTPDEVIAHVAALAGGKDARVLVLPQASAEGDGQSSAAMWLEQGAGEATVLSDLAAPDAKERIARANVIWMPGGVQSRLMERLGEHGLVESIQAAHASGATVGGTSAGAAVLSAVMISGQPEPSALRSGAMEALVGLGLMPWAIVDQHFVERDRLARLITAVIDHPTLIGVGVSEGTAALVDGQSITVMGRSHVLLYDARGAAVGAAEKGTHQSAQGIVMHVLRPGDRFTLPEPAAGGPK